MPSDDTVPGQLEEIRRRLNAGDRRFTELDRRLAENTELTRENTRITREAAEDIRDVRDALVFARVSTRLIKWLGAIGALVGAVMTVLSHWKKP